MKRALVFVLVAVCVIALGYGLYRVTAGARVPPVEYRTAPAERRRLVAQVTASGTLSARVTVQVGSQVSGRVQELFVDWNSPVKKGQLIARIDPQLFQAAVEQSNAAALAAKAAVTRADIQAFDAERTYTRVKALAAQGLAGQAEVDAAETNAKVARTQVDTAKAALAQAAASANLARVNLSYTKIVSPIDGVVISRSVDVGQTVAASLSAPVLFTIAEDLRKMQLDTNIAEGDVGRLAPGQRAAFTVDAYPGSKFDGEIAMIRYAPQTVQNVVTYDAVLAVENPDLRLRPGMTANIGITYQEREDALTVPNAAFRFQPPGDDAGKPRGASTSPDDAGGGPRDGGADGGVEGERPRRRDGGRPDGGWAGRGERGAGEGRGRASARRLYVLRGAELVAVEVRTGLTDGSATEVLSGDLREGDLVVLDAVARGVKPATTAMPGMGPARGGGGGGGGGGGRRSGI
ncbi:MAG: efflux RND transporter periplasmic adaptor subunit [Myxococcales bacterium]|nr:efflux RND transporter periplasmic adaptor subunit [Myxococcales bacterium]HQY63260.1 efflux RND transporter periplasmic adaptor subunit [Polyangiaceae bacterium]